jgi:hypothetical protein
MRHARLAALLALIVVVLFVGSRGTGAGAEGPQGGAGSSAVDRAPVVAADWHFYVEVDNNGGAGTGFTWSGDWPSMTLVDEYLSSTGVWDPCCGHGTGFVIPYGAYGHWYPDAPYAQEGAAGWFIFQLASPVYMGATELNYFVVQWNGPYNPLDNPWLSCSYRTDEMGPDESYACNWNVGLYPVPDNDCDSSMWYCFFAQTACTDAYPLWRCPSASPPSTDTASPSPTVTSTPTPNRRPDEPRPPASPTATPHSGEPSTSATPRQES